MADKTYSNRSNCIAGARVALGKTAKPGVDFNVVQQGARFAWLAIAKAAAPEPKAEKAPKGPAAPRAHGAAEKVAAMLRREGGATIAEIAAAMGWLPHTTRAFISVAIKRKLGLNVARSKEGARGSVYRVAA